MPGGLAVCARRSPDRDWGPGFKVEIPRVDDLEASVGEANPTLEVGVGVSRACALEVAILLNSDDPLTSEDDKEWISAHCFTQRRHQALFIFVRGPGQPHFKMAVSHAAKAFGAEQPDMAKQGVHWRIAAIPAIVTVAVRCSVGWRTGGIEFVFGYSRQTIQRPSRK